MSSNALRNMMTNIGKKCCCPFLKFEVEPPDPLEKELIQIPPQQEKKIVDIESTKKMTSLNSRALLTQPKSPVLLMIESEPSKGAIRSKKDSQAKEEEFYSMDSIYSNGSQTTSPLNRRSFRVVKSLRKKYASLKKQDQFQDCKLILEEQHQASSNSQILLDSSWSQQMKDWMEKQYLTNQVVSQFRISFATKLRMQGRNMLNYLIHKLDDYLTFYMQDNEANISYINSTKTLEVNFKQHTLLQQSIYKSSRFMSYLKIHCNTYNYIKILKWLNSLQTMAVLHHFYNVSLINGEQYHFSDYPLMEVQQYDKRLKGKIVYHIAKQIEEIKYDDQEGKFLTQIDYSLDEGENNFQRIAKIYVSQRGYIEIYTESSQDVAISQEAYFKQKWKSLEQYLQHLKMVPYSGT